MGVVGSLSKGVVTWDDLQRQFLVYHSLAMLEHQQCCNYLQQCCNNVIMLC